MIEDKINSIKRLEMFVSNNIALLAPPPVKYLKTFQIVVIPSEERENLQLSLYLK